MDIKWLLREFAKSNRFLYEAPKGVQKDFEDACEYIRTCARTSLRNDINDIIAPAARAYCVEVLKRDLEGGNDAAISELQETLIGVEKEAIYHKYLNIKKLYVEHKLYKWKKENLEKWKSTLVDKFLASLRAYLAGEAMRNLTAMDSPFEPLQLRENGSLAVAAKPLKLDSVPVGKVVWQFGVTVPHEGMDELVDEALLLSKVKVNILVLDDSSDKLRQGNGALAENIVANYIYQMFFQYAPNVKVIAYSDDSLVRNLDRNLKEETALNGMIVLPIDWREFKRTLDDVINHQPSDLEAYRRTRPDDKKSDIVAVYVCAEKPDDSERAREELTATLSDWASQHRRGVHFLIVGSYSTLKTYNILDSPFGQNLFEKEIVFVPENFFSKSIDRTPEMTEWLPYRKYFEYLLSPLRIEAKPMLDTGDAGLKLAAMVSLVKPPRKEIDGAIAVTLAYDAARAPFDLIYTANQASSLFLTGAPGTGKSFTLNNFIYNACLGYSPEKLQLLLLDCKDCVEMLKFASLPHVRCVINSDYDILTGIMAYLDKEQKRRNKLFRMVGVQDIDAYNLRRKNNPGMECLPRILLIVDEFGRLLEKATTHEADKKRKRMLEEINRLVAVTRFAGIHYLCATQVDAEFRDAFKTGLFSFKAKLLQDKDNRRCIEFMDLAAGNGGQDMTTYLFQKEEERPYERFTPQDLQKIKDKWNDIVMPRSIICADTAELPLIDDYPDAEAQMNRQGENSSGEQLFLTSGMKLSNLFELSAVPYSESMEKRHLFVSGALEYMVEEEFVTCACPAFLTAQVQSISRLAQRGVNIAAEVVDVGKVLWWSEEGGAVTRHSSKNAFAQAVQAWIRRKADNPEMWNFLFVVNAERFVKEQAAMREQSFSIVPKQPAIAPDKTETAQMSLTERFRNLKAINAGFSQKTERPVAVAEMVRQAFLSDDISRSVIVLHSSKPEELYSWLRGSENISPSHNRFVLFRLTNAEFSRKITSPSSFKIGELTDTCESDEPARKSGFVTFKSLCPDALPKTLNGVG